MIEVFNQDPGGWTVAALIIAYDIGMFAYLAVAIARDKWKAA